MTSPSQILLVFPVGECGGAESVFMAIARHLDRSRFEPAAWFLRTGPLVEEVRTLGVNVFLHPITRLSDPVNFWRTVKAGRRLIIDAHIRLVLSSLGYGHLYGGIAAHQAGVDAVWWQHGIASPMNLIDQLAVSIPAKMIITSSRVAARAHVEVFGMNGIRLEVIHPGVEIAPDHPDRVASRQVVLDELGIQPGKVVIAAISRLQPGKGQDIFIRSASSALRRYPQVMFLLVGSEMFGMDRGYELRLKRLAVDLGIEDKIVFTGFRRDVPRLLEAIDIFVHPATAPESFGLSVVEAMAAGKPVIVTDVGGPRETVIDGQTGLIVQPNNEQQLSEAIETLLANAQLREQLGRSARDYAGAHFSQRTMIEKVEAALHSVLEADTATKAQRHEEGR
ncbi:MAG: glycosyltransferase family 4 protein [Acidobacteria bacterium]|nr:glycosyltransferase family 4 protein [Acidobacteriota bacterium]